MDLTTATPAQIDAEYVEVHLAKVAPYEARLASARRARRDMGQSFRKPTEEAIAAADVRCTEAFAALTEAEQVLAPYDAEFARRGGWSRAFLVKNNGGHIHSTTRCSTCNNGYAMTQFFWLTDVSGHDEAEIVAAAGQGACTVCYPSAPVDTLRARRTLVHQSEVDADWDRAIAEEARRDRAAKKLAKALLADGSDLRLPDCRDRISTLAAAKAFLTDSAMWNDPSTYAANHEAGWRHPSFSVADTLLVAAAVAHKLGTTAEVEIAAAVTRASKRR